MTIVLGGGLAGLSAGYFLSGKGKKVTLVERENETGGLTRTISHRGFRFDLGGHRFITDEARIEELVREILGSDCLTVPRKSSIFMKGRYFDYPLNPSNVLSGLGPVRIAKIISDYFKEKIRRRLVPSEIVSLEDWVVARFGREMFDLYFRNYSEKVWGIECGCISREWVARRIQGLSLWEAVKNAFFKISGRDIPTLADRFLYPRYGIGQIAEGLRSRLEEGSQVLTNSCIREVRCEGRTVKGIKLLNRGRTYEIEAEDFVSTIPLPALLNAMRPAPPPGIADSASFLHYRDLVIVTVLLDRKRVTDLTWLYLPERTIPVGRIHEPKNWSAEMAPEGMTHLVAEYFCFRGDGIWDSPDEVLERITVGELVKIGLIRKEECIGSKVVRVGHAYPLLDTSYRRHYERALDYLGRFTNLEIAGRTGRFRYYNMDHAIASGLDAAGRLIGKSSSAAVTSGSI